MSYNAITINNAEPTSTGAITVTSATASFIQFGQGESVAYSTSGASSMAAGSAFYFYDSSPVNNITGATFNSGWRNSFTLPAGKYQVTYQTHVVFSATGVCGIGLYNGSTLLSTPMQIGNVQAANSGVSFLDLTTTTTLSFKITQSTNVSSVASQGNTPSEYGQIFILKVQ
jgi:hypothetical protein